MRIIGLTFFLSIILLIICCDDPVSSCPNDDIDTTDQSEELYEITVHLNTENCELDYNKIRLRFTLRGEDRYSYFTIFEDSAVATMDSLTAEPWRGWITFYKDSTFLEDGRFRIDIVPNMLTDYYFDYLAADNRDRDYDAIKPDHEYMENLVFAAITDSIVNEFRAFKGDSVYYFVHDSTYYKTGLTDLNSFLTGEYPTLKTSTFIDYYIANQTNIAVNIKLDEDKFEYFDLRPNDSNHTTIDSLQATDPNVLGGLIFTRVGFSPSYNQALVFVIDTWGDLQAEGVMYYLERIDDKFIIIAKQGRWIS